jgi:hypothetical protein
MAYRFHHADDRVGFEGLILPGGTDAFGDSFSFYPVEAQFGGELLRANGEQVKPDDFPHPCTGHDHCLKHPGDALAAIGRVHAH